MAFNYNWFKAGATTLPNTRVFNRYFKSGDSAKMDDDFIGLEFTRPLAKYIDEKLTVKKFLQQGERYYPLQSITGNMFATCAIFGPCLMGFTGAFMCTVFFIVALFSGFDEFPLLFFYFVLAWNFFWLNIRFILVFIFSRYKGAYIDRQKQTISFTWKVKGQPQKNDFGHATFPLADIEAFYSIQTKNE